MINIHTHTFTFRHVPKHFLPFCLVRFFMNRSLSRPIVKLLNEIHPFIDKDVLNRFSKFVNIGSKKTQEDIFLSLIEKNVSGTKFCVLSMDMDNMGAGSPKESFIRQLEDLVDLKKKYGDIILPFICVDPRRKNILDVVKRYIEEKQFAGIKLYPSLGYYPFDNRLHSVYRYAELNKIPVTTHCSSKSATYYRGDDINMLLLNNPYFTPSIYGSNKDKCDNFSNPKCYDVVMQNYPNLHLNLAHFGGVNEWDKYISNKYCWVDVIVGLLNKKYPNLYVDTAYLMYDKKYNDSFIKLINNSSNKIYNKVLFGTDWYMETLDSGSEKKFIDNFKECVGEDLFKIMTEENSKKFLNQHLTLSREL